MHENMTASQVFTIIMEIILYDVILPKLFCVFFLNLTEIIINLCIFFTSSKTLKVSDHVCMCPHCTVMKWFH